MKQQIPILLINSSSGISDNHHLIKNMKMNGKKRISVSICCQTMLFKTPGVASYIRDNPKANMAVTPAWTKKNGSSTSHSCEGLLPTSSRTSGNHFQYIKSNSLGQWPALSDDDMIAFLHTEAWGCVCWNIWMPLLISLVFLDPVKIVPPNNNGPHHLGTMTSSS